MSRHRGIAGNTKNFNTSLAISDGFKCQRGTVDFNRQYFNAEHFLTQLPIIFLHDELFDLVNWGHWLFKQQVYYMMNIVPRIGLVICYINESASVPNDTCQVSRCQKYLLTAWLLYCSTMWWPTELLNNNCNWHASPEKNRFQTEITPGMTNVGYSGSNRSWFSPVYYQISKNEVIRAVEVDFLR